MVNLKELRKKIGVVQSTRKVTAAMKMVAGVKLRKIEQKVSAAREYAKSLHDVLARLNDQFTEIKSELFIGREEINSEMLIVFVSDRGLCGNYNYLLQKSMQQYMQEFFETKKTLHIQCAGTKLLEHFKSMIREGDSIELLPDFYQDAFENAKILAEKVIQKFQSGEVDRVSVMYTHYYSALKHEIKIKSLIPLKKVECRNSKATIFEPSLDDVLNRLLPYNIGMQIYQAALESMTSEQSSRMTAMDNATRNADDLLSELTIKYNRTRQYGITQELTEVVSGAQAIKEE